MSDTNGVIDDDTGVYVPISDPYSFYCLIDYIGATVTSFSIVFEDKLIHLTQMDNHATILHRMCIYTSNLVDYYLNPGYEMISFGVDTRVLRSKLKGISKKSILTLFNNISKPQEFMATTVSETNTEGGEGTLFISTMRLPEIGPIEVDDYITETGEEMKPSLTVQVSDISKKFGNISNTKCKYAQFDCYARGMLIRAIVNGKTDAIVPLGKCANPYNIGEKRAEEINGELLRSYYISNDNIKPFSKINNVSPKKSTLRIYYSKDKPLKIAFPVGTIGFHEVFLMSIDPTTMKPV